MAKRKTHEEFINELKETRPNIKISGKYENCNSKLCFMHLCNIFVVIFLYSPSTTILPSNILFTESIYSSCVHFLVGLPLHLGHPCFLIERGL